MPNNSLIHDVCWIAASQVVEVFRGVLRDDELHDACESVYLVLTAAFEAYEIQRHRQEVGTSMN